MSDESFVQLQAQETVENYFKKNKTWSLLEFLKFRVKADDFTHDKKKEHSLYKKALDILVVDNAQARNCFLGFKNEKSSRGVHNFWTTIEKKHYEDRIEKESLGYINDVIDDSIKDSKDARTFLSDMLKSFVKGYAKKRNHNHIEVPEESNESNSGLHTPDPNKKAKTDFTFNAVKSIQEDSKSAHTDPFWWGVLDFREENVSPSLNLSRAKNFLSNHEINRFMSMVGSAIQEEEKKISKSAESLLEALLLSEIVSLQLLAKECGARGVTGIQDLLQKSADKMQDVTDRKIIRDHLANVDVDDDATIYVGKCIEDTYTWISRFPGQCQSERTVDMFLVGPFTKTPQTIFTYGKNHFDADRSETQRVGKSSSREADIGENSRSTHKDNHDKAKKNLVDVIKVSRTQHIELETQIIEKSERNPLPESLRKGVASVFIPFFQIVGMRIKFYLLFQINGDLYGFGDWASEFLPTKNADVGEVVLLCKRFLVYGNLVERVGRMTNILFKKSKIFKGKATETLNQ